MKRFLLFFLLLSLLTSGVSFADLGTDYCVKENKCDETGVLSTDLETCLDYQKAAQKEHDDEQGGIKTAVKPLTDELDQLEKDYADCIQAIDPVLKLYPSSYQQALDECDIIQPPSLSTQRTNKEREIAIEKAKIIPFEKSLGCANISAGNSRINFIGSTTSSFALSNINVGKESSLDIIENAEGETNILNRVLKLLTQVIGTFAVLMLIIGAFYMITSQGDESQLQKGKNIFFYTVIGLLIAFMSFIAVQFVISVIFTSTG